MSCNFERVPPATNRSRAAASTAAQGGCAMALSAHSLDPRQVYVSNLTELRSQPWGSGFAGRQWSKARGAGELSAPVLPRLAQGLPGAPDPPGSPPARAGSPPGSRRHTCPGALPSRGSRRLPAAPAHSAAPRGHLPRPGRTRPAASTTHPAQPREPRVSVSAKLCRRPRGLSNFPAARERPLPASAREPEGSLAAIPRRLCGPALTGGGPQGRCQSRWPAQAPMASTQRGA